MNLKSLTLALWLLLPVGLPAVEPFFFIQLADPQFGMFTNDKDFAQETANLEFAVATINRLRPAFVVVSGDLVNKAGDPAQIREYQRVIGQVAAGILCIRCRAITISAMFRPADIATTPIIWVGPLHLPTRGVCGHRPELHAHSRRSGR